MSIESLIKRVELAAIAAATREEFNVLYVLHADLIMRKLNGDTVL